jgi:bifunctional non-homologous end joining protein LigD
MKQLTKTRTNHTNGTKPIAGVSISHPDRVLYPEQGLTKQELAEFYETIADWILPHISNRPLTLVRCPSGREGDCFYQKHLTHSLPEALRGITIQERGKIAQYVVLDNLPGLISLVQMGVLEIHPWLASADQLEKPDRIIFDLDPGPGVTWEQIVTAAREVRERIERFKLQSFVQTSGGKGLHVVIPLAPQKPWDEVKAFAKALAQDMTEENPTAYIATASKAKRKGKVFIDYLRNSRGATAVSPYSTRARQSAPLATPLRWDELSHLDSANYYTVSNIGRRLSALKNDPWDDFFSIRQLF